MRFSTVFHCFSIILSLLPSLLSLFPSLFPSFCHFSHHFLFVEHENNTTDYTLESNSTTRLTCGLPGHVRCGKPAAGDFQPTAHCADMIGPGGPTAPNRSTSLPPLPPTAAADVVTGHKGFGGVFRHHLPANMGSDEVYEPLIPPAHLFESVNSPSGYASLSRFMQPILFPSLFC